MIVDDSTFEQIVNLHYQGLFRFALSLSHREAHACDLVQETFRKFATKAAQIESPSKVKTWLFTTLYREFIDGHRRDSKVEPLDSAEHEFTSVAEADQGQKLDGALAREALMRLEETFRAPLVLFYLKDLSYREIADVLGLPLGTVMSRISRGREMLREMLADPVPVRSAISITSLSA